MLKGDLSGLCSKRIDETHRLVYRIVNNCIEIASCRGHYDWTQATSPQVDAL